MNKIKSFVFSYFFVVLFLLVSRVSFSQDSLSPKAIIHLGYGAQWPISSPLSKRYGQHGSISLCIDLIKHKWETGPSIHFIFGSNVKEDVLALLRGDDGELIGSDHQIAEVNLKMRGLFIGWSIAREIKINPRSMLVIGVQPGWLAHWIKFQNPGNTFEPIQGDYRYGYDRLSTGLAMMETFTYRYQSSNRLINFELSAMMTESTSHLKRNIQFDQPTISSTISSNLFGIQVKWLIPIYSAKNAEHIFY